MSALLNPGGAPARVLAALTSARFAPVTSAPLLAELRDVLSRPRIARRYGVTRADVDDFARLLAERSEIVPIGGTVRLCRDSDDDVVIETAIRGRANALMTRDDDLKGAADVVAVLAAAGIRVLSVQRFLDELDEGPE